MSAAAQICGYVWFALCAIALGLVIALLIFDAFIRASRAVRPHRAEPRRPVLRVAGAPPARPRQRAPR